MLADDRLWRAVNPWAWGICILCLMPAFARMTVGRGRRLDAIWAVVLLLAINRESFLFRVSPALSHASAALLALVMAAFSAWYQRHDA